MKKTPELHTRGTLVTNSYNETERSIDVTFVTETPVLVTLPDGEQFYEVLSTSPESVRSARSANGLPVIDDHNKATQSKGSVKTALGRARDVRYVGQEGRATIFFSKRSEVDGLITDIKDNIVTDLSVGYRVFKYIHAGEHDSLPMLRAIDWEATEISFTLMPVDINSTVRSGEEGVINLINSNLNNPKMTPEEIAAAAAAEEAKKRALSDPAAAAAKAAAEKTIADNAVTAERERSLAITDAVRSAKLDTALADRLIKEGVTIDKARAIIIEEFAKEDPNKNTRSVTANIIATADARDKFVLGMEEALLHRSNPGAFKLDPKNEFNGLDLVGMARECMEFGGEKVRGLYAPQLAKRALGLDNVRSMHTTSDFPIILGNTVNRVLRRAYEQAPQTFRAIGSQGNAKDFRQMTMVQMSGLSGFEKVIEGAEYKFGTFGESKEVYAVSKYGKIYAISWEMIVNDDLSAFNRIPSMIGDKASVNQSNIFWGIITSNAAMGDGVALFHATHGNLAASGSVISVNSLSAGRAAMRLQKDAAGDFISVEAKYLVVPPELEQVANQFTSTAYVASQQSNINPQYNTKLEVIVEPRLSANSATAWYLVADPSRIPTIEYSFLEGEGELFVDQRIGFEVDGLQIKARSTFGAKSLDWRGFWKNPGA